MDLNLLSTYPMIDQLSIRANYQDAFAEILNEEALRFLVALQEQFNDRRIALLAARTGRQKQIDEGILPTFLPETESVRSTDWKVAPVPADLQDRRVEITGPVERKMVINALNSGAKVFMADFEDSNTPNWENTIQGQINLRDANLGTITFEHPKTGKKYSLKEQTATLMVRPRGWHLEEKHITYQGKAMSGSLVDFGLYIFHNHKILKAAGSGPYFYLPKLESHLEARLWNDVFVFAQDYLGIPQGTIKATVLIETILASFELDEILFELKEHSAGLNCGRWDYIFSFIKKFRSLPGYLLPDRDQVTMTVPFMQTYSQMVIKTCHRRGVHAMGGMAAQIPIKNDPEANERAIAKVRVDKLREVKEGHDGTWVAHPGLVQVAMEIFNEYMPEANQVRNLREDLAVDTDLLLAVPAGTITEAGVRKNINVGILYVESWLRGNGAAAIYHLMEDAATAEISRTQLWQWIKANVGLADGRKMSIELFESLIPEELEKIKNYIGEDRYQKGRFEEAVQLFRGLVTTSDFIDFLTLPAYELID